MDKQIKQGPQALLEMLLLAAPQASTSFTQVTSIFGNIMFIIAV